MGLKLPLDPLALTALSALRDQFLGLTAQAKISAALRASLPPPHRPFAAAPHRRILI
jgi:hypothetical protein